MKILIILIFLFCFFQIGKFQKTTAIPTKRTPVSTRVSTLIAKESPKTTMRPSIKTQTRYKVITQKISYRNSGNSGSGNG